MKAAFSRGRDPIEVSTGEVRASSDRVLRASALGSCVAVAMLDAEAGTGGLAHVMLPGASPDGQQNEHAKYAETESASSRMPWQPTGRALKGSWPVWSVAEISSGAMTTPFAKRISHRSPGLSKRCKFP